MKWKKASCRISDVTQKRYSGIERCEIFLPALQDGTRLCPSCCLLSVLLSFVICTIDFTSQEFVWSASMRGGQGVSEMKKGDVYSAKRLRKCKSED